MSETVTLASLANVDLLLSILAPERWDVEAPDEHHMRLFGPVGPGDVRPTWSVAMGEPDGVGDDWFAGFAAAAEAILARQPGYAHERTDDTVLSSLVPLHATWFRWTPDDGVERHQVQAYVPAGRFRMYRIDASSTSPADMATFAAMLGSIRLLPPR